MRIGDSVRAVNTAKALRTKTKIFSDIVLASKRGRLAARLL